MNIWACKTHVASRIASMKKRPGCYIRTSCVKFPKLVVNTVFMTVDNFETFVKRNFAINAKLVMAADGDPN